MQTPEQPELTPEAKKVISILEGAMKINDPDFELGEIGLETLIDHLAIDSLLMSEIIFQLEDDFHFELSDLGLSELAEAKTISDFIKTFLDHYDCDNIARSIYHR